MYRIFKYTFSIFILFVIFFTTSYQSAYSFTLKKKKKEEVPTVEKPLRIQADGKVIVVEEPKLNEEQQEKKETKLKTFIKKRKKKNEIPSLEDQIPDGDYRFVKYNDLAGEVELDLTNLKLEKQLNTAHCISPDFTKMAYTQVYFYPSFNRVGSELYYIVLDKEKPPIQSIREASIKDKVKIPLLSQGLENTNTQIFKTIISVDWSYDSTKLLIKTRQGETQRNLWECGIWVYDFENEKIYKLSNLKKDIRDDYYKRFNIILSAYQWDIQPIGWDLNNTERVIVYAYGTKADKHRIFLGAWSVGFKKGDILFLSKNKDNYQIGQYGYKIKRFD